MSLLNLRSGSAVDPSEKSTRESYFALEGSYRPGLIARCANPECRSGVLHLFRSRNAPVFEQGWTCSPECTETRIWAALRRELDGAPKKLSVHPHRIPLGLLMLERGWITRQQLREALQAQKSRPSARIGELLIRQGATDEAGVTRALALQWGCPVLFPDTRSHHCAPLIPRLFLDAFGALPLRVAAEKVVYMGFEERLDPVVALAVERMLSLRVESGVVPSSAFGPAFALALAQQFPPLQVAEAVSARAAARLLARAVERTRPVASHLVRVHDFMWLRMWRSRSVNPIPQAGSACDVICSIGAF